MKHLALALIFAFTNTAWADCPEHVQLIVKGEPAVCDGVLMSPDAFKKADEAVQDVHYYKLINEKLNERQVLVNKEIEILDKRLKLYMDQSQVLASELTDRNSESKWEKLIYFSLGVFATGIAVYGASHLK